MICNFEKVLTLTTTYDILISLYVVWVLLPLKIGGAFESIKGNPLRQSMGLGMPQTLPRLIYIPQAPHYTHMNIKVFSILVQHVVWTPNFSPDAIPLGRQTVLVTHSNNNFYWSFFISTVASFE